MAMTLTGWMLQGVRPMLIAGEDLQRRHDGIMPIAIENMTACPHRRALQEMPAHRPHRRPTPSAGRRRRPCGRAGTGRTD